MTIIYVAATKKTIKVIAATARIIISLLSFLLADFFLLLR